MPYTGNVCDGFAVAMTGLNDLEENIRLDQECRGMVPQIVKAMGLRPCSLAKSSPCLYENIAVQQPAGGRSKHKDLPL